jgi:bifunctional DNA-binding transcriptional regulator/antitoxin component of YhaV-PrlF toxin-antitoxin module
MLNLRINDINHLGDRETAVTTVSSRWQTVVPLAIRRALNIAPQSRLEWEIRDGVIHVHPVPADPYEAAREVVAGLNLFDQLMEERRQERAREQREEQQHTPKPSAKPRKPAGKRR